AGRELDLLVGGDGIVASEAAAGAKEQRAILFGKKGALAQIIPDESIGLGEAKTVAIAGKFRQAQGSASPNVACVISAEHVDVERGQPVCQTKIGDLRFSIRKHQAS